MEQEDIKRKRKKLKEEIINEERKQKEIENEEKEQEEKGNAF